MLKNKKGEIGIIAIAIFVILGAIALSISNGVTNDATTTITRSDDTFTASNTSCVTVVSDTTRCIISKGTFENATNAVSIGVGNFTLCNSVGTYYKGFLLSGSDATERLYNGVNLNATYTEASCSYSGNSFTLTLLPTIIILLTVIVFMTVANWVQNQ